MPVVKPMPGAAGIGSHPPGIKQMIDGIGDPDTGGEQPIKAGSRHGSDDACCQDTPRQRGRRDIQTDDSDLGIDMLDTGQHFGHWPSVGRGNGDGFEAHSAPYGWAGLVTEADR